MEIYRKEALKHLDSPEQLDTMMQVAEPRRWLALMGVLLLIVVSLVWAVLGRVPVLVSGEGVILSKGGVRIVYAPAAGRLEQFSLGDGEEVLAGQSLGRITPFQGGPSIDIVSPGKGRVVEILADVWAPVDPTVPLFKLEDETGPLRALLFMTPAEGAEVKPGMAVQVSPKVAGQSEYGHISGTVEEVAHYPWSTAGLTHLLENPAEVEFLNSKGFVLPVSVSLKMEGNGYAWSGSKSVGPSRLYSGLICTAKIVVDEKAPISLILGSH